MYFVFCNRLNEGLKQAIVESDRKSAVYAKAKADGRLNLTFPPVNSHEMAAPVNHRRQSYTFSGWSDNPVSLYCIPGSN